MPGVLKALPHGGAPPRLRGLRGGARALFSALTARIYRSWPPKAAVFGGVAAVTGLASSFAASFAGQAPLAVKGIATNLGEPGALRPVNGAGLYLAVLGLFALELGTLIRRTAGVIAAAVGLIIILPVLVQGLPPSSQAARHQTPALPPGRPSSGGPSSLRLATCCLPGQASRCSVYTPPLFAPPQRWH